MSYRLKIRREADMAEAPPQAFHPLT